MNSNKIKHMSAIDLPKLNYLIYQEIKISIL